MEYRVKEYTVRTALNSDGPKIKDLVDPSGEYYPGVQWTRVEPWWAVVLDDDEIIACAQLIASYPIAHIEFLTLEESLSNIQKAGAIKSLVKFAHSTFYSSGIFVSRSSIPLELEEWAGFLEKRWAVHQFDAGVFDMRMH